MTRYALITGGSGGIGLALATLLAKDGYSLVLVARNKPKLATAATELKKLGPPEVLTVAEDLSDPKAADRIFKLLRSQKISPEVLINNAGFGDYGPFVATDRGKEQQMIAVNVAALTDLIKLLVPGMVAQGRGRILNVASTASFQPGPLMAVYFATKAYVLSFSNALSEELRGTGVTVTALCPGPTATGFGKRATDGQSRLFGRTMKASTVARLGYRAMLQGRPTVVTGATNRITSFSVRFFPRQLVARVVHRYLVP